MPTTIITRGFVLCVMALFAQGPSGPCADCNDPSRPWMRGTVEKYCGRAADLDRIRKEHPEKTILACLCQHVCDPDDPRASETRGRRWDAGCEARCNPTGCQCPDVCDS